MYWRYLYLQHQYSFIYNEQYVKNIGDGVKKNYCWHILMYSDFSYVLFKIFHLADLLCLGSTQIIYIFIHLA